MSERKAHLAFLTKPEPGRVLLNLKVEGDELSQLQISPGQLWNLVVDGAQILREEAKRALS